MSETNRDEQRDKMGRTRRIGRGLIVAMTLALGVGAAGLAMAHGPGHSKSEKMQKWRNMSEREKQEKLDERVDRKVNRMTQKLDLTDDQQVKIREIMSDGHEQARELFDAAGEDVDRREVHREIKQIRKDNRAKIRDVLTDEQAAKAKNLRKERHAKRRAERPKRMMERLDERLDLDEAQEKQVEAIFSEAQQDIRALIDDDGDQQRGKSRGEFREHRKEIRTIMKGAADDIESVLDKEQAAEFTEIREEFRERRQRRRGRHGKKGGMNHHSGGK